MAEAVLPPRFRRSARPLPLERRHPSMREHQARKPEQREVLGLIPDDAAIAHLVMPEEILDDMEGMPAARWRRRTPGERQDAAVLSILRGQQARLRRSKPRLTPLYAHIRYGG